MLVSPSSAACTVTATMAPASMPTACPEHLAVRFHADQPPSARQRRMIRRGFVQADAGKASQAERIGRAPGDAAFGVDALAVADQQGAEVTARGQRGPAVARGVEAGALGFDKLVELCAGQQLVELLVKRLVRSGAQFTVSDPEILLPLPVFSLAHRHQQKTLKHFIWYCFGVAEL